MVWRAYLQLGRSIPACAGNAALYSWRPTADRFIPACAGNAVPSRQRLRLEVRFIPACAGNTIHRSPLSLRGPVHPRVCGEHAESSCHADLSNRFIPACAGNTTKPHNRAVERLRFIPACAGNTNAPSTDAGMQVGSSPRVRGTRCAWPIHPDRVGSSPRVRGTPARRPRASGRQRFIPACAGNTGPLSSTLPSRPVHPRVCGEHLCC